MAYSDDRKLMVRTKRAARALGIAATWVRSGQPVNTLILHVNHHFESRATIF